MIELFEVLHFLLSGEPGRFNLCRQIHLSLHVSLQDRSSFELKAESLGEEPLYASDVSVEVELGVEMVCRRHLWEIDHCNVFDFADHEVELIEIAMDEAMFGEFDN